LKARFPFLLLLLLDEYKSKRVIKSDYPVMSGEKKENILQEDLIELIADYKVKFPTEYDCYNFLYQKLKELGTLDERQCKCRPQIVRQSYKSKKENFLTGASGRVMSIRNNRQNPDRFRLSGGIGQAMAPSIFRYNIPNPLPKELMQHRDMGVFAECNVCHHKYFVTKGTILHKRSSPMRSLLSLLLIAEYYDFDIYSEKEIMLAFRFLQLEDVIGSTVSISEQIDYSYNAKTLYAYKDLFTSLNKHKELRSYKIMSYL
jgi:hypothetical protein